MSIGRDLAAAGVTGSQRAYAKIQKDAKALRCWEAVRQMFGDEHSANAQCGKVPQFCFLRGGHSFAR